MSVGKRTLSPYVIVNGTSMAGSFQSNPTSLERFDRAALEIICTGAPTGTVTVQVSVDFVPSNNYLNPSVTPANWYDLPLPLVPLAGAAQTYLIDLNTTAFPWIRINYNFVGGAGNMTAVITAKES